ncbi:MULTISPECIES: Fe-S cluster assembly protein SufD [unclassified Shinella]|jgi:Fe-S cluster assembly protein SufD|uniref:Fe-S cluster assembly protein SufD n=1 Tax=unclassified Shinella TaxID=2643062 RepID=UPI00234EDC45|nr:MULTISPECIES: Fe-S cluster assembly protein SufD [unclassified Shinella]MCO5150011.1 Fe-S cluster assembly protein SufD [Shinella sp.]MDC7262081.1 Fe-S cluster assembly protein SufD [Shinella sp. HY16]MDC7268976.1 Fe-S cluster assembly protein SufD [Shinella sp. YZ44]
MNMQTGMKLSVAETALCEAYDHALGELPGDGAVLAARDVLISDFKDAGLPTRRIEAWHYTDLKALLRAVPAFDPAASAARIGPLVEGATVLSVVNGLAEARGSVEGVTLRTFADALADGTAADGLAARDRDDAIGRINGAFVRDGFVLDFPAGTELAAPLEIQTVQNAGQAHTRFPVSFGANTKATVIERHAAVGDTAAFVTTVSDLSLADGADITWVILQGQGAADTHLGQIRITLGTDAKLRLYVINAGGKLVRQEIHVVVAGEGSDLILRGINLLGGETHNDVTFTVGHDVPNTTSTEVIRNVIFDRARGVFQGQIRVAPDAQKTDAKMSCNTLLLSDEADFSAKPELEIFADDVQCGHGATVIDIDHTQLFYLMARGIPENKARAMLVNAFVAEIVEELEDEPLVEALEGVIADWLDKHA